ncbi:biofilm formation regulator HmsP [Enterobacteriaceae bacterium 4M9]|nr:biofilm formation regulator HmsP [Enterobacteriaceae bacterium 4M9]
MSLRVRRSLTIKQMAMVAIVSIVFIFVFVVVQLFHFVQQSRYTTATQMESIAHTVRKPLSAAILRADIPEAENILNSIQPVGVIGRADVVLPNQFQALRVSFINERPVPVLISRLFELPVQITLPLYSLERPANPQPLAYLVLQADAWRMYKFIISTMSTLITTWLLLALVMTVAITWCINRLIVHPLRKMAKTLDGLDADDVAGHQLEVSRLHQDDEIGMLVRSYNRNQQRLLQSQQEAQSQATRYAVSGLPNKTLLQALLDRANPDDTALLIVACETLRDAAAVLNEEQRDMLLLSLVDKIRSVLPQEVVLAQVSHYDFAVLMSGVRDPWQAMMTAEHVLEALKQKLPMQSLPVRPSASIGIAMSEPGVAGELLYRHAVSAMFSARRHGKHQIQFFNPEQMDATRQRMTEEHDILQALEHGDFALWLQPQVDLRSGQVVSAEVLLRQRQPDGEWALPEGLIEQIERCGLMVRVGNWILEESCRLLADWQRQDIHLALSVNLSALQLLNFELGPVLNEMIHRHRVDPSALILEVTESRRLSDPDAAVSILRPLHDAGIRIAMDDFGMGYASLHQLHRMKAIPIDILKIDKVFIDALPADDSMVEVILSLAARLELEVVAEGVENDTQCEWLRKAGAHIGQGYLFDKPLPVNDFITRYGHNTDESP